MSIEMDSKLSLVVNIGQNLYCAESQLPSHLSNGEVNKQ